jgi:hypothetical protein
MGFYDQQFDQQMLPAEAVREVRARGCTTPGVAEAIVEHHGASFVLLNLHRVEELGSMAAAADTETGAKMRALLTSTPAEVPSPVDSGAAPTESSADAGAVSEPAPAGLPSAADLDAVAAEQKVVEDTPSVEATEEPLSTT